MKGNGSHPAASRTAEYMAFYRALESVRPSGRRLFTSAGQQIKGASFRTPALRADLLPGRSIHQFPVTGSVAGNPQWTFLLIAAIQDLRARV